jgi:serine/threonine protein kinase/Tfp pilus assembly protein PilF
LALFAAVTLARESPHIMTQPDPNRWRRIAAILDEVLDLELAGRAAGIAARCDGDLALSGEVERMLAGADAAVYLESPALAYAVPLLTERAHSRGHEPVGPDPLVGPYRVVKEIAHGGMGVVYLAERADGQFEQRVALKLVRRGIDSDDIARRFLAERQILARLTHPNIARLLDGGVSADGQPYFAMEFIPGEPITSYCDDRRLGLPDRLRLFADVCEAVHYAHQNLVVHRDLKPSNILVTAVGEVKLLDFGIAKVLSPQDELDPAATQTGLRLMTPTYAAPEQVRGNPVTTTTDVYALGLVLYELLAGRPAHRFERHTPAEYERVVCETEPEAPSTAIAKVAADPAGGQELDPAAIAEARGTLPQWLRRDLRGDLDTIVIKAIQKEPARRYASVEALLQDLARHAGGLPVQARPDALGYRATKFLHRHRLGVAAGTAVIIALLAGLAGTIWQARTARREAVKANEVKTFLVSLFKTSDPRESLGKQLSTQDLLARGVRRVNSALTGQPAVKAELLHTLADIHMHLGLYDQADSLVRRALVLSRRESGARSLDVADELNTLGAILYNKSAFAQADSVLAQALEIRRQRLGLSDTAVATTLTNLAAAVGDGGDRRREQALLREALAIDRRARSPSDPGLVVDLGNLGNSLSETGAFGEADSALRAALAIGRARLPADHPDVMVALHNLAGLRNRQGEFVEAESLERQVLAGYRRVYPAGHPDLAYSAHQLASMLENQGRYVEAESLLTEALAIRLKTLGPDHDQTIATANNVGVLKYRVGDLAGAEPYLRQSYEGWLRTVGPDHPHTTIALGSLGADLSEQGRYAEGGAALERAVASRRRVLGDSSVEMALTLRSLGAHYHRVRRYAEAERVLRETLAIDRARLSTGHPSIATALTSLGALLTDIGRASEAEPLLREALAIRLDKHGPTDQRTAETQRELGSCLAALGRYADAEQLLLTSERSLRTANPASFRYAQTLRGLVRFYEARHRSAEARRFRQLLPAPLTASAH